MNKTFPILRSLSLVNLNGITARTLELVKLGELPSSHSFTSFGNTVSLLGENGAGKTTILGAYQLSLLADIRFVSLGTSDKFKKAQLLVDSEMFHRLGNPSTVALEVQTRNQTRHLYVIHAEKPSGNNITMTRMRLVLPEGTKPMDCLAMQESNSWVPFTPSMMRDKAASSGCLLTSYANTDEYLYDLFDDGVLPKLLQRERDKANLAHVFHSAMSGRLDESIERNLSAYLMSHSRGSIKGVVDILQESMRDIRLTRIQMSKNIKDYDFFRQLLDLASAASSYAWAVVEKRLQQNDDNLAFIKTQKSEADAALKKADESVNFFETQLANLNLKTNDIQKERQETEEQLTLANKAADIFSRNNDFKKECNTLLPQVEDADKIYKEIDKDYQQLSIDFNQTHSELTETQFQLADAVKAFDITSERAGKYDHACRKLKEIEDSFGKVDPQNLIEHINHLKIEKQKYALELNELERHFQKLDDIRDTYHKFGGKLHQLGENVELEKMQQWVIDKRAQLNQLKIDSEKLHYEENNLKQLEKDQKIQNKCKHELDSAKLETLPNSSESFIDTLTLYRQKVRDSKDRVSVCEELIKKLNEKKHQLEIEKINTENRHQSWIQLQPKVKVLVTAFPEWTDWSKNHCEASIRELTANRDLLRDQALGCHTAITKDREELNELNSRNNEHLDLLRALAEDINGLPVCDLFNDIDPVDACYMEAALGELMYGILVDDPNEASRKLLAVYGEDWPLEDLLLAPGKKTIAEWRSGFFEQDILFKDITADFIGMDESVEAPWCILVSGEGLRISQVRTNPVLGDKARNALIAKLENKIKTNEEKIEKIQDELKDLEFLIENLRHILPQVEFAFSEEPNLEQARNNIRLNEKEVKNAEEENIKCNREKEQLLISLNKLEKCEPFVETIYQDIKQKIRECEVIIKSCKEARREINRFASLFKNFEIEWALLFEPYPRETIEELKKSLEYHTDQYNKISINLRNIEMLHEIRFHFGTIYVEAKALLQDTNNKQQNLKDQAERLDQILASLKEKEQKTKNERDKANEKLLGLKARIEYAEQECQKCELALSLIDFEYFPKIEETLAEKKAQYDKNWNFIQKEIQECNKNLLLAKTFQLEQTENVKNCEDEELRARTLLEEAIELRKAVREVIDADGVSAILQEAMHYTLNNLTEKNSTFQEIQSMISKVNACAQNYGISVSDPLLEFSQKLTGTNFTEVVHLYAEAVKLFKRRTRQDLVRSGDPQQMLMELDEACRMAQKKLNNAEALFQANRGELGEAIAKRVVDEKRAVSKLSKQLSGIGFGQVAEVRLTTDSAPKFDNVLNALRQGSQAMDDLFASAESVEDALSVIYHRTTSGEIKGEKLLDHRNYLIIKTQYRRKGSNEFEDLEGTHLSTGERLGAGLIVLISIIKHWADAAHGKKGFAIPLVMDEVSRLDAQSQATVAELSRRCGVQLLMAAPESLGKITGLGYQLVRVWPEGANINNPSKTDKARSWVQITGLQESTELSVNSKRILESIVSEQ